MTSRLLGILGGLGPDATVDFMARVLRADGATLDQEHVRMLVACDGAIPNRNEAIDGGGPSPGPALAEAALRLERGGAELILMVCNAAHAWQEEIRAALTVPFISLVEEAARAARDATGEGARIGILAAHACHRANLYPPALAGEGLVAVVPNAPERAAFMEVLTSIKAGEHGPATKEAMGRRAHALVDAGAEALLAACTEVGIVLMPEDVPVPFVDSTEVLVRTAISLARATSLSGHGVPITGGAGAA